MENLCFICPRKCGVDRNKTLGFCKCNNNVKIAKVMLHHFEEPPISGDCESQNGSGAIFFSGCNLKCCYCQNSELSHKCFGKEISVKTLADIFEQLEAKGAYNINLVTPTHFAKQIVEALKIYKPKIPVVWNTSGYETAQTIKMLSGYVDIFLTDFKYFDDNLAKEFSLAPDYAKNCIAAIKQMRKNVPEDVFENGLMKKGIIIRHLVLPNCTNDSKKFLSFIAENFGKDSYVSLMSQYVPMADAFKNEKINRKIKPLEYKIVVNFAKKLDMNNVFVQDFESASEAFTPNFKEQISDFKF